MFISHNAKNFYCYTNFITFFKDLNKSYRQSIEYLEKDTIDILNRQFPIRLLTVVYTTFTNSQTNDFYKVDIKNFLMAFHYQYLNNI